MSTESDLNPDLNLPDELRSVEASLQNFVSTASGVNRDTLMYQAGWAAASMKATGKRAIRIWQAASGVLAASLLIALAQPGLNESPASNAENSQTLSLPPGPVESELEPKVQPTSFVHASRIRSTAPLLVMRKRALAGKFNELPISSNTKVGPLPTTTNRQLLEEFLPSQESSTNRRPNWPLWKFGEPS